MIEEKKIILILFFFLPKILELWVLAVRLAKFRIWGVGGRGVVLKLYLNKVEIFPSYFFCGLLTICRVMNSIIGRGYEWEEGSLAKKFGNLGKGF